MTTEEIIKALLESQYKPLSDLVRLEAAEKLNRQHIQIQKLQDELEDLHMQRSLES